MFDRKLFVLPMLLSALVIPLIAGSSNSFAASTTMTLNITGGGLSISAPASVDFGSATSGTTATVTMGSVTVTDLRGVAGGGVWVTTAIATALTKSDLSSTIAPTAMSYAAGTFTHTGTVTLAKTDVTDLTSAVTVVSATAITGGNTGSWTPTMTVIVPIGTPNGAYSGSITQSVA